MATALLRDTGNNLASPAYLLMAAAFLSGVGAVMARRLFNVQ